MRFLVYFLLFFGLFTSCTKDRIIPEKPILIDGETQVISYWDFNTDVNTDIMFPSLSATQGEITYFGNEIELPFCDGQSISCWETVNDGTTLNAVSNSEAGRALRLRNPADELTIAASTEGFYEVTTSFAVKRTGSGAQTIHLFYTADGANYGFAGLEEHVFTITEAYEVIEINLGHLPAIQNNPNFKLKMVFKDGNNNSSGNTRFDNLLVAGKKM